MTNSSSRNPSRQNVLLLLNSFETGGAEGQLLLLARSLLDSGRYGVNLACLSRRGRLLAEAEALGVGEIPEFPLTSFYDRNTAVQLRRFVAFLRERIISVVHTDGFYTNIFGITGAALARVPARVGFRGETNTDGRTAAQNFIERFVFRFASVIHANSEAVKAFLIGDGVPERKITVVYNGLDLARVTPPASLTREAALEMFDLPRDPARRLVTIIANLHNPVKDYPMFLRAAARVHAKMPDAAFVIAGEGELLPEMRRLSGELNLDRDTFFIGRCDRIGELLFLSDVCVLSSKAEGFSNSILEYMGAGRPVVATDVGGAREAIEDGETGYIVPIGNDEAMADRIIQVLSEPERARMMGAGGRKIVEQKFASEYQLQNTLELYDGLLTSSARSNRPHLDPKVQAFS